MEHLLAKLREFDALRDGEVGNDRVDKAILKAISPTYADEKAFDRLSPRLVDALHESGIDHLYQHQAEAILKALDGNNVVLQAPTASGKSLAFQIPMLDTLARETNGHALMLYPTKALALDQRDQLLTNLLDHMDHKIESWWYDGDTEKEERKVLREKPPPILITNPDMLHFSFLGHADQWQQFLRNLKWVIIDEIHEYRGYFGSNVAMILRRFSHHLAQQDIHPHFFLSSATCANAREHAENLTGLTFEEVNASDSYRPHREFYFVQPDIPDHQYWNILQLRTVNAGLACLALGKSVLVFCPTRNFAEQCHRLSMQRVKKRREQGQTDLDPDSIKVFRAGLSKDMRHEIQKGLKQGSIRLVFTTNALELGIDIGGLDGVVLAGFPDSMMSAWQRIGRAGRNWNADAFVLYYARNNPLDQFYAANLGTFLDKPLDDLVINPENEDLIERHLPCLIYETPNLDGGEDILGAGLYCAAVEKLRSGAIPVRSGGYRPHISVDIRGGGSGMYTLEHGSAEIGTMSGQQQFREAYQRAIYMHGGSTYRVEEVAVTGSGGSVRLGKEEPFLRTNPFLFTTLTDQDVYEGHRWTSREVEVIAVYGKVAISEILNSVEEVDERSGKVLDRWVPDFNTAKFTNAHVCWIQQVTTAHGLEVSFTALQHILRVGVSFAIPIDTHDVFPHAVAKDQKIYIVKSYSGGIGIARKVLERWCSMLEKGIRIATSCSCTKGCPNCIVPPRSREDLDKRDGISLARSLLAATENKHDYKFSNGLWEPTTT